MSIAEYCLERDLGSGSLKQFFTIEKPVVLPELLLEKTSTVLSNVRLKGASGRKPGSVLIHVSVNKIVKPKVEQPLDTTDSDGTDHGILMDVENISDCEVALRRVVVIKKKMWGGGSREANVRSKLIETAREILESSNKIHTAALGIGMCNLMLYLGEMDRSQMVEAIDQIFSSSDEVGMADRIEKRYEQIRGEYDRLVTDR